MVSSACPVWCKRKSGPQGGPPMQDNPGVDAPEAAPEFAIGAPPPAAPAALVAALPAALLAGPPAGAPHGPPPGLPAGVAPPRPEIRHDRLLQHLTRLKAHWKTLARGYPLTDLPEEAVEGDEEMAQAILRANARQQEEERRQVLEAKRTAQFNKRVWENGRGCRDLWSESMSMQQVQQKVLGALDAYVARGDPDELRDKVQARS